jgi:hypothetical protein
MSMTNQESQQFDFYFKEIVQESTCKTCIKQGDTDGYITLFKPFEFYSVKDDNDVLHSIHAVDCETGILLSESKYVRYTELSLYDIHRLYIYVVLLKRYKFVSNTINNKQYGIKE